MLRRLAVWALLAVVSALHSPGFTTGWTHRPRITVIDGDNLRGKLSFQVSKEGLLSSLSTVAEADRSTRPPELFVCVFDHGAESGAFSFHEFGICLFSGPQRSADDLIATCVTSLIAPENASLSTDRMPYYFFYVYFSIYMLKKY